MCGLSLICWFLSTCTDRQIKTFADLSLNTLFDFSNCLHYIITLVSFSWVYCTAKIVENFWLEFWKLSLYPKPTATNKNIFFIAPAVSLWPSWKSIYHLEVFFLHLAFPTSHKSGQDFQLSGLKTNNGKRKSCMSVGNREKMLMSRM